MQNIKQEDELEVIGFSVPLSIESFHKFHSPGFRGALSIRLPASSEIEGVRLPGTTDSASFSVAQNSAHPNYRLTAKFSRRISLNSAICAATRFAQHLTFLLNREEMNAHYGTLAARLAMHEFRASSGQIGSVIRSSLSASLEGEFEFDRADWLALPDSAFSRVFWEGAAAAEPQAQFFHWFRIIEMIEGSPSYRAKNWDKLFSEKEKSKIEQMAKEFADSRKSSVLLNTLTHTQMNRAEKLACQLRSMGVPSYLGGPGRAKRIEVQADMMGSIIQARNKLFHADTPFDPGLLWEHLFPLVVEIVDLDREGQPGTP